MTTARTLRGAQVGLAIWVAALVACGGGKTTYDALFLRVEAEAGLSVDQVRLFIVQEVEGRRDVVPRDPDQFPKYTFATAGRDLSRDPLVVKLLVGTRFTGAVTVVALGGDGTRVVARGVVDADLRERREVRLMLRGWLEGCDQDGDGFSHCNTSGCCAPDERFPDCNDAEPRATPVGHEDDCTRCGFGEHLAGDEVDDDCDGAPSRCRDQDGDQAIECLPAWCQPGGESEGNDKCKALEVKVDCDPGDATVFSGGPELCDGKDNDCDGQTDDGMVFTDWDGAERGLGEACGTGACAGGVVECDPETKKARCSTMEAAREEVCGNRKDDNCNGHTDDPVHDGCEERDTDGDGVQDWIEDTYCGPLAKYHSEVFPEHDAIERPEVPEGVRHPGEEPCCCDYDGVGLCPELCDRDCDGTCRPCEAGDGDCDGFPASVDCDDNDPAVHPGAADRCGDGMDQDCVGGDPPCTVGVDSDKDGFLAGFGDCDDSDSSVHPVAQEACNGRDDDCDGYVDNGNPGGLDEACGSDVGECEQGVMACTHVEGQGPRVECRDFVGPTDETCDGKDNDCDGQTDEDFFYDEATGGTCIGDAETCRGRPGIGEGCDGIGECGVGKVECLAPPSREVTCSSNPDGSAPQVKNEVCNNLDDDCDGQTDQDLTDVQQSTCKREGVCGDHFEAVIAVCKAGVWSCSYDQVPGYEEGQERSCDERDNDCDGDTDEDFVYFDAVHPQPVSKGAGCGTGVCANGKVVCGPDHKGLVCDTSQQQAQEVCDGLDNDCDGPVDEDFQYGGKTVYVDPSDPDKGQNTCTGIGECGNYPGKVECASLTKAACSTNPDGSGSKAKPEVCNNKDDNCNGQTDEGLTSVQDSTCKKTGVCLAWMDKIQAVCQAGVWQCDYGKVPYYQPGSEKSCDGLDNDCDGQTDEDFWFTDWDGSKKLKGEVCGTGRCAGGQVVCRGNQLGLVCSSAGQAVTETCNNLDDDCDGQTDEGLTSVQDSTCKKVGVCQAGMDKIAAVCKAGKWSCDYSAVPGYEEGVETKCDTYDNDCDGQTDEDFEYLDWDGKKKKKGQACGTGLCAGGKVVCKADLSGVTCSTATLAEAEACNGVDDDCDGQTDDGTDILCWDGKACTDDKCEGGKCKNPLLPGYCLIAGTCYAEGEVNPQNQCQYCKTAGATDAWSNQQDGTACDHDADGCTLADFCLGGVCEKGPQADCSHLNTPCVLGYCFSTGPTSFECRERVLDGKSCDDGNACTTQDKCVGETCQGTPYSCDDYAPCTVDTCLGDGGCSYSVAENYCEIPEGSKNCVPSDEVNPHNECLACLPDQSQTSWSPRPLSTGCDDENACTIGDHCENGECKGTPLKCEAWNPTCSEGDCYCDLGPPPVQCDGDIADTCDAGTCKCGTNPACVPTSKNPTCVSGTCQCGTTVCDDRSDRCVAGACKCGNLEPCGVGKVCCNGTCCGTGKKCCPDLTCKASC